MLVEPHREGQPASPWVGKCPVALFLQARDLILSSPTPHTRQKFPCFKGLKTLRLCWGDWTRAPPTGLQSQQSGSPGRTQGVLFPAVECDTPLLYCGNILALLGRNWMHRIPWEPVTFSRFTFSHRPWNIAGIVSLICANPIPRGLTSSALLLLEVIPPPPPQRDPPPLLGRVHTLNLPPPDRYILPISVGVPLLGDGPVNPSAAFQKGDGEATDRSHTVQNISPLDRTLAPRQNGLS